MSTRILPVLTFIVLCLSIQTSAQTASESTPTTKPEHYAAVAYFPRATARTASHVDIRLARYSSDAETKQLAGALLEGGSNQLIKALQKSKKIGSINISHRVGFYDFKLVRSTPTGAGRQIVAVTDRPIGFLEAYNSGRSVDYKLGILILDLKTNNKGKETGEGTLLYAAKVKFKDDNSIELEYIGIDPIRLGSVRKY